MFIVHIIKEAGNKYSKGVHDGEGPAQAPSCTHEVLLLLLENIISLFSTCLELGKAVDIMLQID